MEKKIPYTTQKECSWGAMLEDGRVIPIHRKKGEPLVIHFDTPIKILEDHVVALDRTSAFLGKVPKGFVTLNDLKRKGKIKQVHPYIEYQITIEGKDDLTKEEVDSVCREFAEHGFNVTADAIGHNLSAWRIDYKSGYRDEANGYHLFSPCGCNPLTFIVTSLNELCEDWQTTYIC